MASPADARPPGVASAGRRVGVRPTADQVVALAGGPSAAAPALRCADPVAWSATGHDDVAVWGRYVASATEPYEVAVDLTGPAFRCSCPSRKVPCKHALALLLLLADGGVVVANRLPFAAEWLRRRHADDPVATPTEPLPGEGSTVDEPVSAASARTPIAASVGADRTPRLVRGDGPGVPDPPSSRDRRVDARAERMRHGVRELDRWLADRVRVGLSAPEFADPATWEHLAARLVDAQCGALANRVRRVATRIGQHARWYEDVLAEMAVLHLLAVGLLRTPVLPPDLADGVHTATGLTTATADVLAGVPDTDRWVVAGESRTREDRITVQRTWLQGSRPAADGSPRWAMLLTFGTVGNEAVSPYPIGSVLDADVHWYPGAMRLRALVGTVHAPLAAGAPRAGFVVDALASAGRMAVAEPWIERVPICVEAVPVSDGSGRWSVVDETGSLPIVPGHHRVPELVSLAAGRPLRLTGEWSADGLLPLVAWPGAGASSPPSTVAGPAPGVRAVQV